MRFKNNLASVLAFGAMLAPQIAEGAPAVTQKSEKSVIERIWDGTKEWGITQLVNAKINWAMDDISIEKVEKDGNITFIIKEKGQKLIELNHSADGALGLSDGKMKSYISHSRDEDNKMYNSYFLNTIEAMENIVGKEHLWSTISKKGWTFEDCGYF